MQKKKIKKRNNENNILIEQDVKITKDFYSCNDLPNINTFEKSEDNNRFVILSKLNNDNSSEQIKELNKKIKSKKLEFKQKI